MDIIQTVIGFCGTVSETESQYKLLDKRLNYEVQKAEHQLKTEKVKSVPKFMLDNLKAKITQAKEQLQKIQNLLKQDKISLQFLDQRSKQKIKLSLPFNKTSKQVNTAVQALEKALQDVSEFSSNSSDSEYNGKRPIEDKKKLKKQQTMSQIIPNDQVNDEDIEQALMGPTVEEDAAIEFTKNKYVVVKIHLCGLAKIIKTIKDIDPEFLVYKQKLQIKYESTENKEIQEMELFSLGRLFFKPVYGKLRTVWADVDRISKQGHFVIKLRKTRKNTHVHSQSDSQPQVKPVSTNQSSTNSSNQQFFSFPATDQVAVKRQTYSYVIQRAQQKSMFIVDETGRWEKMNDMEKEVCSGDEIAPWIPVNKNPLEPDLYFKIQFDILE